MMYNAKVKRFLGEDTIKYDKPNSYKYMFIETAIKQIYDYKSQHIETIIEPKVNEYIENNSYATGGQIMAYREEIFKNNPFDITWMISEAGYSNTDLENFQNTADKFDVTLVIMYENDDFIDHTNNAEEGSITDITFFSHGTPGSMAFGYSNDRGLYDVNIDDINLINGASFSSDVFTMFYSCNVGTEVQNNHLSTLGVDNSYVGKSFAQEWNDYIIKAYQKSDREVHGKGYTNNGSLYYPIESYPAVWKNFKKGN